MTRHNGWRNLEQFETWEGQSKASDEQAIRNFKKREQQLTRSQMIARRMFIGLMLLGILGLAIAHRVGIW